MGKDFKKRFTVSLDIDTKDAEKQIKSTVSNLKAILANLGTASDKMAYFKELADYLSQIDVQLNAFKQKYGEGLFNQMFGGLDESLQKELESVFGITKEQLTVIEQLKEKVAAAKQSGTTTGADLKPLEQEVRSLYESIGMLDKLDLSGKGKVETRIKKLETALNGFVVIWDGLNNKVKQGFGFGQQSGGDVGGNIVESLKDTSKNVEAEFNKLKKLIKQKVKEVFDAQVAGVVDEKQFDVIKKPLYEALSLSPNDDDFYKIEDAFDELLDSADEDLAIEKITAIVEAQQKAKQKLSNALSSDTTKPTQNTSTTAEIKSDTEETVKVIDIAKKKLVAAWKQYFNDVEEAKKDGYDLSQGGSSIQMDATQFSINQMLKEWGAKATKGQYQSNVEYALDLSGFIIDGDIGINDIENEINKMFQENGITVDIPLEKISLETPRASAEISELSDEVQESTNGITSNLGNVEIKTNDVATAFQNLINYISQSGQSPQSFFNALAAGAQTVDDELKNILQSLNLIDTNGGINLKSLSSGFSNSGGMISDDYVLISREQKKLPYSLDTKQKTAEAKALGANIGAVLEVYEDKVNGLIYELQNKVSGEGILDFKKGIVNTDFLEATDDQIEKLIEDLLILQKTGLYVDWNGDNILYDKDNGFSFIDFFTKSVSGVTVGKDNTVQENIEMFFDQIFGKFSLDTSSFDKIGKFKNHVNDLINQVVNNNNAQQTAAIISQDTQVFSDAAAASLKKEESAHEQNTEAINAENQALQAQIELKKKAQSMTWESFALDESTSDLKKMAGIQSLSDMEKFWKQANYEKPIAFRELSSDEMNRIINSNQDVNFLREQWYGNQDFDAKNLLENKLLENDELRNAAMNKLWQLYQKASGQVIDFYDFINKEFEVYRGDVTPTLYSDQQKHSFSFSKDVALSFIHDWDLKPGEQKEDYLKSTRITPKETLGNLATKTFESEYEMWIPNAKSPYVSNMNQSFDEYYKGLDNITQKALDYKLVQLEKSRVANLLGEDVTSKLETFTNSDIIQKFNQGEVPKQLNLTGNFDDDSFIQMYNNLPELQKKLVAYYQSLISLSTSLSDDLHNNGAGTYGLSKTIGKTNVVNAVISDPSGVKEHVSNLTNESKFGILGQDTEAIQQETVAHQQNTQAIQQEQQAQEILNNTKIEAQEVLGKLNDLWYTAPSDSDQEKQIMDMMKQVQYIESTPYEYMQNGEYMSYDTGELLNYTDLLDTIQKFEQDYGENLSYVKDYLEQVFAQFISESNQQIAEIQNITPENQLEYGFEVTDRLSDTLDQVSGDQFIALDKILEQVSGIKYTDSDLINSGKFLSLYDKEYDYADLLDAIDNYEQKYGESLDYVRDYLKQTFANYDAELNKMLGLVDNAGSDDELILDGFDSNSSSMSTNSQKELQVQQDITAEKQKQVVLDQQSQVDTSTEMQSQDIQAETTAIDGLQSKINEVEQAVADKTAAFTNEGIVVEQVVQQEISALDGLLTKINDVKQAVDDKTAAFEKEGTVVAQIAKQEANVSKQSASTDTKAKSDISKTTNDSFTKSLTDQTNVFNKYRENLKDVSYISDDLKDKLDNLGTSLHQVTDTAGLNAWKNSFSDIQKEVTLAENTFIAQQTGKVNQAQKALKDAFKKSGLKEEDTNLTDEQQKIVDGYMQAKAAFEAYNKLAQKGNQIELSTLQNVTNELYQQIEAYKQKNNIVDGSKKTYGDNAIATAKGKYNSLSQVAKNEFADSTVVQDALNQYTAAYQKLIDKQKEYKAGQELNTDQKAEFKQLQTECNKYATELNKLIAANKKFEESAQNVTKVDEDFVDTAEGRMKALQDFVQVQYGATAEIGKFDAACEKLTFTVDNGNGTFTQMTAAINPARNAIGAMVGDVKEATSAFGQFFNELKGKVRSIFMYLASSMSLQEVWQQLRQGVNYVREIDSALTELKKVTDETDATYEKFLQTASKTASVIGSTVSDFTNATADFARLGYNLEQATSLAEAASVYKNVGDGIDDISQASESIISTMKAFGIEAENAMGIVDRFNEIGNNFAISSTGIGEAMQRSASALYEAGNTIDESVALITAAMKNWLFIQKCIKRMHLIAGKSLESYKPQHS